MSTEEPSEQQQLGSNNEGVEKQGKLFSQGSQPETEVSKPNGTAINNNSINSSQATTTALFKATEEEEQQPTSEHAPPEPASSPEKSAADGSSTNSTSTPGANTALPTLEKQEPSEEPAEEFKAGEAVADMEPVCEKVEHAPLTDQEAKEEKAAVEQVAEESSEKAAEEPKATGKRGLPKWMVEDAEDYNYAPSSPSEPEPTKKSPNQGEPARGGRGKGKGRGRAAAGAVAVTPKAVATTENAGTSAREVSPPSSRPRRSTRRIDYANPDSATVIAEVDDEEPGGLSSGRRGGGRGRGRQNRSGAAGKPKKRKAGADSSASDDNDEDGSSDYGSSKKKKRSSAVAVKKTPTISVSGAKGKRGRPAGSKSKTTPKTKAGRPAAKGGRKGRKGKTADKDSDDEEGEVIYDDQESGHEDSPVEEDEATTPKEAAVDSSIKAPAKKRGRPATKTVEKPAAEVEGDETEEMEEA